MKDEYEDLKTFNRLQLNFWPIPDRVFSGEVEEGRWYYFHTTFAGAFPDSGVPSGGPWHFSAASNYQKVHISPLVSGIMFRFESHDILSGLYSSRNEFVFSDRKPSYLDEKINLLDKPFYFNNNFEKKKLSKYISSDYEFCRSDSGSGKVFENPLDTSVLLQKPQFGVATVQVMPKVVRFLEILCELVQDGKEQDE